MCPGGGQALFHTQDTLRSFDFGRVVFQKVQDPIGMMGQMLTDDREDIDKKDKFGRLSVVMKVVIGSSNVWSRQWKRMTTEPAERNKFHVNFIRFVLFCLGSIFGNETNFHQNFFIFMLV